MGAAATHTFDDRVKRHIDFQHVVEFDARSLHRVRLRNGAGKPVEQETCSAVGLGNTFLDEVDDEVVADQCAGFHDGLGLQTQWRACFDRSAQHVAGGDLGNAEFLADECRLRALPGAWCAQQNQSHGEVPWIV